MMYSVQVSEINSILYSLCCCKPFCFSKSTDQTVLKIYLHNHQYANNKIKQNVGTNSNADELVYFDLFVCLLSTVQSQHVIILN